MVEATLEVKKCNSCHQIKPLVEFTKDKAFKNGYRPECKDCNNKRLKELTVKWAKERAESNEVLSEKLCKECNQIKPISEFTKDKYHKDGYYHLCNECKSQRHQKMIKRWKKERPKGNIPTDKKCIRCNRVLSVSHFTKSVNSKDSYDSLCKDCQSKRSIKYKVRWIEERKLKPSITEKKCLSCDRLLPASEYYESDVHKDGLSFYCKKCELKKQKEHSQKWESKREKLPDEKQCNICHRVLPASKFYKNRKFKDGLTATCINCESQRQRDYMKEWKEKRISVQEKECIKCHRVLPISQFNHNKRRKDGLTSACKECEAKRQEEYMAKWDKERSSKPKDESFTLFPSFEKQCSNCKQVLHVSQFYKRKRSKDGLTSECRECQLKRYRATRKKPTKKKTTRGI